LKKQNKQKIEAELNSIDARVNVTSMKRHCNFDLILKCQAKSLEQKAL